MSEFFTGQRVAVLDEDVSPMWRPALVIKDRGHVVHVRVDPYGPYPMRRVLSKRKLASLEEGLLFDNPRNFKDIDDFYAWCDSRGELASLPFTIGCFECGGFDGKTTHERRVIRLGAVVNERQDATQTYVLSCGHTVI